MTDQSVHERSTRPTRTLERAGPDGTGAERSAEDGAVYHGAAPDAAVSDRTFTEPAAHGATDDPAVDVPASVDDSTAPDVASSGDLLPGDVPVEPVALFDGAATQGFRDRWQQLQLRFIDDPHTVAAQAGALADEMVTTLRDAVDRHRAALEDWQSDDDGADAHFGDTERLRVAVRRYRDFVDRLLAM